MDELKFKDLAFKAGFTGSDVSNTQFGGYKQGFDAGKTNTLKLDPTSAVFEFDKGYVAGYKDGRGKKKRLYK